MIFISMRVVGSTGHGTITLNTAAATDTTFALSASDSKLVVLPTVTVPAGSTSADFLFGVNAGFTNTNTFRITAQSNGSTVSALGYTAASSQTSQYGLDITAASADLMAAPGGRSYTDDQITVSSVDGYSTTATLSCDGLPAGVTCAFSPATVVLKPKGTEAASAKANLVLNVDSSVVVSPYQFNIMVSDGMAQASTVATITVTNDVQTANIVSEVHADREDVAPKEKFVCIATVKNTGNAPATNVHVNFALEGTVDLMNLRSTAGTCTTGAAGEMYCDIPTLAAGASAVISADLRADDIGQILFTMDTTGQNLAPTQTVSTANYSLQVSDFAMASQAPHTIVAAGQTATFPLNVAATFNSFDRAVTLTCSGLPALASCNFSQNNFVPKAGASVNLNISTKAATKAENTLPNAPVYAWLPFASILALGMGATRRKRSLVALGLLLVLTFSLTGCAGFFVSENPGASNNTNNSGGTGTTPAPGTPAGTYTVLVTASAGSVQHTTSVTLVVQ